MMNDVIQRYLQDELDSQIYEDMRAFLLNPYIFEGKFKARELLVAKLNTQSAMLYKEFPMPDGTMQFSSNAAILPIGALLEMMEGVMLDRKKKPSGLSRER